MASVIHPLKRLRLDQGLTLAEFAERLGVHASTVSDWENRLSHPQPRHVRQLAKVLRKPRAAIVSMFLDSQPASAA